MAVWIRWGVNETLNKETKQLLRKIARASATQSKHVFVTSANDGIHGDSSLHYTDDAFDHFQGTIKLSNEPTRNIRAIAGKDFDILKSGHNSIHSEFDPK